MTIAANPDVTVYSGVEKQASVTEGQSVSIWISATAGATQGDLALMTGAILLLMTGGSLLLV